MEGIFTWDVVFLVSLITLPVGRLLRRTLPIIYVLLSIFFELFYDSSSIADSIASYGKMVDEQWVVKDLKGSDIGVIEVMSRRFSGGTEENR
jgi:hypothetical protein